MSGTNHITGGIVFTAIFASFFNVNIFASPWALFFTAFFSALPDIDHTRTPIGKLFYPLAKHLDRKYGHRTITHSLICYITLYATIKLTEIIFNTSNIASFTFAFAYASHLIFDMMTKQGVPLFYPFKRNPCVIPANPQLRLKASCFKTEAIIFCFFVIIGITCQPLFANGFWSTYNNSFATIPHIYNEFKNTDKVLEVEYEITNLGHREKGKGILLNASNTNAYLLQNKKITELNNTQQIHSLKTNHTKNTYQTKELYFNNISCDSLKKLIEKKAIINLKLQSSSKIQTNIQNKQILSNSAEIEYCYSPILTFINDSINTSNIKQLELLKYDLQEELKKLNYETSRRSSINNRINTILTTIGTMDNYNREKATTELQILKNEKEGFAPITTNAGKLLLQISQIDDEISAVKKTTVSGYLLHMIM